MKAIFTAIVSLIIAMGIVACGGTGGDKNPPAPENKAPVVKIITGAQTITLGESILLQATSTDSDGTITESGWGENNAVLGVGLTYDYVGSAIGVHTIIFAALDNDGATASATVNITVVAAPPPPSQNTRLVIPKSDLPDMCDGEISRVQIFSGETYSTAGTSGVDFTNMEVWTLGAGLTVVGNDHNISIELPRTLETGKRDEKFTMAHVTIYCYSRPSIQGDADNVVSYDWDWQNGIWKKSPFSIVIISIRMLSDPDGSDIPPELQNAWGAGRFVSVMSVSSNKELYTDWTDNNPDSIQTLGELRVSSFIQDSRLTASINSEIPNNEQNQNIENNTLYRFNMDGFNGYIQNTMTTVSSDGEYKEFIKATAPYVLLFDGTIVWGDFVENTEYNRNTQRFDYNLEQAPNWLQP